jgi:hypothetical protein
MPLVRKTQAKYGAKIPVGPNTGAKQAQPAKQEAKPAQDAKKAADKKR